MAKEPDPGSRTRPISSAGRLTWLMETLDALLLSKRTVFLLSSPAKYESLRAASAANVSRLVERRRISGLALFSISSGAVDVRRS